MGVIKQLRETEPFNHLPDALFVELRQAAIVRKYPSQIHIFNQHDPPTGYLYLIKEGLVEIVILTPGGVEMVVDYRHAGQFFGGTPIFSGAPYTAGARTVRETECYLLPEELLKRAEKEYPPLREYFMRVVLSRVKNLYADIVSEHNQKALTQVEAFPFKKRLSEIMSTPVEVCSPQTPIQLVARQMCDQGVGSVLVIDDFDAPIGIITEKDIIAKVVAADQSEGRPMSAGEVMTAHPHAMSPDRYMYEAMSYMLAHRIKHLPVVDREEAVGIVTLQDLMRFRSQKSMLLIGSIKEAGTLEELVVIRGELVKVAKGFLSESRSPFETMEILSYIHHAFLMRAFDILLEEMSREGLSPPDVRYCFFVMGSGGRREMLLGPDQDNGIIFEDFPDERLEEVNAFFVPFAERLVAAYAMIGYPLCNGEVMANNPLWRGRLGEWQARVSDWIRVPEPKKVMYATIFFDFMPLKGDATLCQDLRDVVHAELRRTPRFLYHLLENDLNHKAPLNLLGRFVVEKSGAHKGQLSLKKAGSVFIVDCIRMFLLEQGLDATTSIERLDALVKRNVLSPETGEHIKAALEAFTFLRLRNEIALIDQGLPPSDYIDPNALTKTEQDLLRESFRAAAKLQDSARRHFGRGML